MKPKFTFLLLLAIMFASLNLFAQSSVTYYVSAAKGNDAYNGTSMITPFKTLRKAVELMRQSTASEVQILLEKGTYHPYNENGPLDNVKDAAFLLCRNDAISQGKLKVLGGYDFATGTRDFVNNLTYLSGEGKTSQVAIVANVSPIFSDSIEISGFTITGTSSMENLGETVQYSPTITLNNRHGAGIVLTNAATSKILIRNCVFTENKGYYGGGLTAVSNSRATIQNCVFYDNASMGGAGAYLEFSSATFLNCIFTNNTSGSGALNISGRAQDVLIVSNCSFGFNNSIFNYSYEITSHATPGLSQEDPRVEITNSIIWAMDKILEIGIVGGLHLNGTVASPGNPQSGNIFVSNILVNDDHDTLYGRGNIYSFDPDNPQVPPAGFTNKPIYYWTGDIFQSTYNFIGDDGKWFTADDGLQLLACGFNPAVESGDNTFPGALSGTDIIGRPRIKGNHIELGAYENQIIGTDLYPDTDGDGYGDPMGTPIRNCEVSAAYAANKNDCNDNNNAIYPGAPEICDGKDNDCDGQTDEGIPPIKYYLDKDGDGFGTAADFIEGCAPIQGRVTKAGDCDDNDNTIHPGAPEICSDGKDNNCNGLIDDVMLVLNLEDKDGDGYGDPNSPARLFCGLMPGYSSVGGDCDDNNKDIYPNAPEICDGKDNNCNGQTDEGVITAYYTDADGDGYGATGSLQYSCAPIDGLVIQGGDCDDTDKDTHPGATEICDNKDNNCNGQTDEGLAKINYYLDADGDGFGKTSDVVASCIPIEGRVTKSGDCNDGDNTIYPGAPEICDGKDNDCDPKTNDPGANGYYPDADGDGYGKFTTPIISCIPLEGYSTRNNDCNDNDNTIYPGAPELCDSKDNDCNGKIDDMQMQKLFLDADGDGYGNPSDVILSCVDVEGRVLNNSDCNDNDKDIHPFAPELCDGKDNNCNGQTDENAGVYYYYDGDGDGFGNNNNFVTSCTPVEGRVTKGNDCNDNDKTIYPGATEICDNKDNDCDGQTDESLTKTNYYLDTDGDGYGKTSDVVQSCSAVAGRVTRGGDCNDNDKTIYPNAPEICDNKDNDCDGRTDENITQKIYFRDADGDGYGNTWDFKLSCSAPSGYVLKAGDCKDNDNTIYPDAPEVCDGKDNDCDGRTDEGVTKTNYYRDADGDGFGKTSDVVQSCTPIAGRVTKNGDCNDNDKTVYPGAAEICDNKDNDCDGQTDEGLKVNYYRDADGDGFGNTNDVVQSCTAIGGRVTKGGDCNDRDININPGANEVCDGKDNDCDGQVDETKTNYYVDNDGDGFGNPNTLTVSCTPRTDRVTKAGDCNDNDKNIYPGATEICDNKDNDCDGQIDEGLKTAYYRDADSDGYGKTSDVVASCTPLTGRVTRGGDCNDNDKTINPGATEVLRNGKDDDCDGLVDEGSCANPGTLSTTTITRTTAVLRWTATTNPTQWQVRYRRAGGAWINLISVPGGARSYEVRTFSCNTPYEWQVRSVCNGTPNEYDKSASFTTSACATATRSATTDESNEEITKTWVETKVWPNPTNGAFTLSIDLGIAETQTASIKIIAMNGSIVYQENTTIPNGKLQKQMNMPAGLSAGVYVIVITTPKKNQQFKIEYLK